MTYAARGLRGSPVIRCCLIVLVLLSIGACGAAVAPAPAAPDAVAGVTAPSIDAQRITVSGISAGGMMAHQLHVAYSDLFGGAAAIAGGPFGCADGSLATAMARCMASDAGGLPVAELADALRADAAAGRVAPLENLADDRVWLFHGSRDAVVAGGVSDALAELYAALLPAGNLRYVDDMAAAHLFPTDGRGGDCGVSQPPFVGDCGFDAAGELLQFLYPGLAAPRAAPGAPAPAELTARDLPGGPDAGLAATAWLYVPAACRRAGAGCALHLVLHGCAQSAQQVGSAFIERSGYLPWADANGIVLAFPQVEPAAANPYACWDWWGYTGSAYRFRTGRQMQVLAEWVATLANIAAT